MITGFEKETQELSEYEKNVLLPIMVRSLVKKKGESNAITSSKAIKILKSKGYKISGARWCKLINYIRINSLIFNLISTSKGYYIATSREECESYIESLGQRIRQIELVHDSMQYQLRKTLNND